MRVAFGLIVLAISVQVPPPNAAEMLSAELHDARRTILEQESRLLKKIIDRLETQGDARSAMEVRGLLPQPAAPGGGEVVLPLAEVVPAVVARKEAGWRAEVAATRAEAATALFALATRAGTSMPLHNALADRCLRGVIERLPNHAEARRLLGFVPFEGGWATPYAVQQRRDDKVFHPVFGWVPRLGAASGAWRTSRAGVAMSSCPQPKRMLSVPSSPTAGRSERNISRSKRTSLLPKRSCSAGISKRSTKSSRPFLAT